MQATTTQKLEGALDGRSINVLLTPHKQSSVASLCCLVAGVAASTSLRHCQRNRHSTLLLLRVFSFRREAPPIGCRGFFKEQVVAMMQRLAGLQPSTWSTCE